MYIYNEIIHDVMFFNIITLIPYFWNLIEALSSNSEGLSKFL